jgi:predicted dehydrogenase
MTRLGIGLIGTGYMGKCHALAWNSVGAVFGDCDHPRLIHLADATPELAASQARALGFEKGTGDWRDLLADPEVDVVSITTPNAFHAEMAIAALEAGKHVWCEKPMAPAFEDAVAMRDAARASGKVAILGYNYIQNPAIRHIRDLIEEGAIGTVTAVRCEMDEDFMADPEAEFYWKSEASSGYGALDDFGVHPLSILSIILGGVAKVSANLTKPYPTRPSKGAARAVETYDMADVLLEFEGGVSGTLMLSRSAWGRKGRIAIQIFGSKGTIVFDQERMNEFALYSVADRPAEQGFRTILTGPVHTPYDKFVPAPGHGLGFNDLKIIEARELIRAISGEPAHVIDFEAGLAIERAVHAMARSHGERRWVEV